MPNNLQKCRARIDVTESAIKNNRKNASRSEFTNIDAKLNDAVKSHEKLCQQHKRLKERLDEYASYAPRLASFYYHYTSEVYPKLESDYKKCIHDLEKLNTKLKKLCEDAKSYKHLQKEYYSLQDKLTRLRDDEKQLIKEEKKQEKERKTRKAEEHEANRHRLMPAPPSPPIEPWQQYFPFEPVGFAELSNWIYNTNDPLPQNTTLLNQDVITITLTTVPIPTNTTVPFWNPNSPVPNGPCKEIKVDITTAYVQARLVDNTEVNILVVRGTYSFKEALATYTVILNGGKLNQNLVDVIRDQLARYERRHGRCRFATGHSLGGRLIETAVKKQYILGIAFNSLLGNRGDRLIQYRAKTDIAGIWKPKADHWLETNESKKNKYIEAAKVALFPQLSLYEAVVNIITSHSIVKLIDSLRSYPWHEKDIQKAYETTPGNYQEINPICQTV